jgi:hypothetical protein
MLSLPELAPGALADDEERRKLTQLVANELSVFADQDRQIRSLIQIEAQTYKTLRTVAISLRSLPERLRRSD